MDPQQPLKRGLVARLLDAIEWLGNKLPEPALLFVAGAVLVMLLSQAAVWAGWSVQPVRLEPVLRAAVNAAGAPVLGQDGQPVMEPVVGEDGRAEFRVVDDTSRPPITARVGGTDTATNTSLSEVDAGWHAFEIIVEESGATTFYIDGIKVNASHAAPTPASGLGLMPVHIERTAATQEQGRGVQIDYFKYEYRPSTRGQFYPE